MNAKREFTPGQLRCIEEHRQTNVEHGTDWADGVTENLVQMLKDFGITVAMNRGSYHSRQLNKEVTYHEPDVQWSVYGGQGDCANFAVEPFTLGGFMEAGRKALSPPEDAEAGVFAKDFYATTDSPIAIVLRQHLEWCEAEYLRYQLNPHLWACVADAGITYEEIRGACRSRWFRCEFASADLDEIDSHPDAVQSAMHALCRQIGETTETWDEFHKDLCHAYHKELEAEYDYQTSDEVVWDTIEANDLYDPAEYGEADAA